ncbi:MAG: glycosyltransferase [Candidatus Baldrarchaeia archaeon]
MKILQVYHIFPALYGGVSTVVYQITKELLGKGHKVDVLTTNARLKHGENRNLDGVGVYRFPVVSEKLTNYNIVIPVVNFLPWVKDRIETYDCIHIHGHKNPYSMVVHHYAVKYGVPYVLQAHGSLPRIGSWKRLKRVYDVLFGYRLLRDAAKVIALSGVEAEQCKRMGVPEEKIAVIPNGIDLSEYAVLPPKGAFKKKFSISEDKKIILYLGRIHRTKGIDFLVRTYAHLANEMNCKDAVLVIAGPDDGYLQEAKLLSTSLGVTDSVLFTGFISKEDKLRALVDADIFVTPSFYGFPMTFLETCAVGTPIITTRKGDRLEWIDGKVGYVTQPTPHDLAEAIYRIICDDELRKKLSRNCIKVVKSNFSIEKIVEKLEKAYKEVVEA